MTKKTKTIFSKLIIIFVILFMTINLLQVFGFAAEPAEGETATTVGLMPAIRNLVSQWYYIFRYFSIVLMLILLIFLGIKLAITSSATGKAQYKRMLMDWVVGFVIIFGIHYFMILVLRINDACLNGIKSISDEILEKIASDSEGVVNSYGLYETIRTRAYEFRLGIGTSGMIMYMVLVYYTIRFTIIYFKRFFTLMILTIFAPLVGLSYAFTKVMSGKAPIITKWSEEYCFNVFLQTIHSLIYTIFVAMALMLSTESIAGFIVALIMLNFMMKAEKIFRKIFKFSGNLLGDTADKSMDDDFSAIKAIKGSLTAIAGGAIAKDMVETAKKGVGAVSNVGLYAGVAAYDGILNASGKHDKDYKQVREIKDEINELDKKAKESENQEERKKYIEEKQKAEDKLNYVISSSEKLSRMEGRRNRLKQYKETDKKVIEANQESINNEIARRIEEENKQARLNGKPEITDIRKAQIEDEVMQKYQNRIKRRYVEYNEKTGKREVTGGIAVTLKSDINRAIWGNNAVKNANMNMIKSARQKLMGNAMIFAAIPLTIAEPKIGIALLGKGIHSTKSSNGLRKVTTRGERRRLIKAKKTTLKNKGYSFNRFSRGAINTIQAKDRMKTEANIVRKINNPTIAMRAFTLPLRLTGTMGAIRNITAHQYKIDKAKKKYYQSQEASYAVARKDSDNKNFMYLYRTKIDRMQNQFSNMTTNEAIMENKLATGTVFEVNGKKLEFGQNTISSFTDSNLVDNAIINVAARNSILDLNEIDFRNKVYQSHAIKELSGLGLLTNAQILSVERPSKELIDLMKKLDERKKILASKMPEAPKERLIQFTTSEYMKDKGIESADEVKKDEHRENIRQAIFEKLEQRKQETKTEEDVINERVEEIVKNANKITDADDRNKQIKEEISKLVKEEHEKPKEDVIDILDALSKRKNGKNNNLPTDHEINIDDEDKFIEQKTEEIMKILDVEEIISSINKKKQEKQDTESFIDKIIAGIKEVKDDIVTSLTAEEESIKASSEEIAKLIQSTAKKKVNKSQEFVEMNEELRQFDYEKNFDTLTDEFIDDKASGKYNELLANILAAKEEDKVLVDLKIKDPKDKRLEAMNYMDEQRESKTYNKTNIQEIISSIKNK